MLWLFTTNGSAGMFIIRVILAIVIFAHGAQKLLGWFGGQGYTGTIGFFTTSMGLPWLIAFLVIIGESVGSLSLLAGFLTRFVAASFLLIMLGAIAMVHWPHGFFMNWFGQQQGEGFEYHLLIIGMSLALLVEGGGAWSVDQLIARRMTHREWSGTQPLHAFAQSKQ
ncbi:MAG: DoxX family protein [Nitrospira sp.]